ncbi:MAG: hypothetical protein AAF282_05580 [Cyanobacteria bacterium P01_A01_bin.15]|mgnify:CR=1 FL=1
MDIQRANEVAKTVPIPQFLLGDVVKTGDGLTGIIIGAIAWDDEEPAYVSYKIQTQDPGPLEDDEGNVWDIFSTQDEYTEYCFEPQGLTLVSGCQTGVQLGFSNDEIEQILKALDIASVACKEEDDEASSNQFLNLRLQLQLCIVNAAKILDEYPELIESAQTIFDIRSYHSCIAEVWNDDEQREALSQDEQTQLRELMSYCNQREGEMRRAGFEQTGLWSTQDIRETYPL